jgi:hypothetical protein
MERFEGSDGGWLGVKSLMGCRARRQGVWRGEAMSCLHRNLRLEACYPCKEAHFKVRDPSSTRASSGRKVAHDVAKRRVRPCLAEFVIVTNNSRQPMAARVLKSLIINDDAHSSHSYLDLCLDTPRFRHRRRKFVIGVALFVLSLLVPTYLYFFSHPHLVSQDVILQPPGVSRWNRMSALLGPPTDRFRGWSTSR